MNNPRAVTRKIYGKNGKTEDVTVIPTEPQGEIHIYKGACGYKLSIGNRHLTLAELVCIVDKLNTIYLYGA